MLLMIHFLASAIMTGVIWVIQLIHYPAFKYIEPSKSKIFHDFHTDVISFFVAPLMIVELGTSIFLVRSYGGYGLYVFVITIFIWLSTFILQVPLHRRLAKEWERATIDRLIQTNWLRTGLWTLKTLIVSYWVYYS